MFYLLYILNFFKDAPTVEVFCPSRILALLFLRGRGGTLSFISKFNEIHKVNYEVDY